MDLQRLQLFREVVQRGSIAAAARANDLDPSSISRALSSLERELGVRLIQRTTRQLTLTEAGATFLASAAEHMDGLADACSAALGLVEAPRGLLRVTASNSFGQEVLAPLVADFLSLFPEVQIDLVLTDALLDLVGERIDVAFRLGPKPSGDLISGLLAPAPRYLVGSPGFQKRFQELTNPHDLQSVDCLLTMPERKGATWLFQRGHELVEVAISGRVATSNTVVVRELVLRGCGCSLLADWVVRNALASGRLVRMLPDWTASISSSPTGVWITYPSRTHLPAKARVFIDHIRARIA